MNDLLNVYNESSDESREAIIKREKLWIEYTNTLLELQNSVFATARAHSISISQKLLDKCADLRKELGLD